MSILLAGGPEETEDERYTRNSRVLCSHRLNSFHSGTRYLDPYIPLARYHVSHCGERLPENSRIVSTSDRVDWPDRAEQRTRSREVMYHHGKYKIHWAALSDQVRLLNDNREGHLWLRSRKFAGSDHLECGLCCDENLRYIRTPQRVWNANELLSMTVRIDNKARGITDTHMHRNDTNPASSLITQSIIAQAVPKGERVQKRM